MAKRKNDTFPCPECGEDVRVGAAACPNCGSDEETGWAEDAKLTALDLPRGYRKDVEDDEDEDDYSTTEEAASAFPMWVKVTLIVVVVAFVLLVALGR